MRSAWRTVDRRWAITIDRPAPATRARASAGWPPRSRCRPPTSPRPAPAAAGPQDRPGDRQALALAARQLLAALADHGVVALRQRRDELVGLGQPGGLLQLVVRGVGPAVGDVLPHRALEQEHVLADVARSTAAQPPAGRRSDLHAVERDPPAGRLVQPQQQLDDRRLARRRWRRRWRGSRPPALEVETRRAPAAGRPSAVGEATPVEAHLARDRLRQRARPGRDRRLDRQQVEDAPGRRHRPLVEVERLAQAGQRPQQPLGHVDEHREQADVQVAVQRGLPADQQRHRERGQDRHAGSAG